MRFLFCPMGTYGFLFPTIGIAKELQRKGHRVCFVASAEYKDRIINEGIELLQLDPLQSSAFALDHWMLPLTAEAQVEQLERAVKHFKPDALITSVLCHGGLMISEMHSLPIAVLGLASYPWAYSKETMVKTKADRTGREARLAWRLDSMLVAYNKARESLGLPLVSVTLAVIPRSPVSKACATAHSHGTCGSSLAYISDRVGLLSPHFRRGPQIRAHPQNAPRT